MPTELDILNAQRLNRMRNDPLTEYSNSLVDVAKFNAANRARQEIAREQLAAEVQRVRATDKSYLERINLQNKLRREEDLAELGIVRKAGENIDTFLRQNEPEANKVRAEQLDTTFSSAEKLRQRATEIRRKAELDRPRRVREAAIQAALPPDKARLILSAPPAERDARLAQLLAKDKTLGLAFETALQKANETIPMLSYDQEKEASGLDFNASVLERNGAELMARPKYAGAAVEYSKRVGERTYQRQLLEESAFKEAARKAEEDRKKRSAIPTPAPPQVSSPPPTGVLPNLYHELASPTGAMLRGATQRAGEYLSSAGKFLVQTPYRYLYSGQPFDLTVAPPELVQQPPFYQEAPALAGRIGSALLDRILGSNRQLPQRPPDPFGTPVPVPISPGSSPFQTSQVPPELNF